MKLKNKKTGEIRECVVIPVDENGCPNEYQVFEKGNSLTELNDEWEDYEEPKNQYYLDCDGRIFEHHTTEYIKNKMKEIGNYFETIEEAEKAVEKLKAWKRLKEKCNFRFTGIERNEQGMLKGVKVDYERKNVTFTEAENTIKDLFLLFGDEE